MSNSEAADQDDVVSRWPGLGELRWKDLRPALKAVLERFPTRAALEDATRPEVEEAVYHLREEIRAAFFPSSEEEEAVGEKRPRREASSSSFSRPSSRPRAAPPTRISHSALVRRWPALGALPASDFNAALDVLNQRFASLESAAHAEVVAAVAHLGEEVKAAFLPLRERVRDKLLSALAATPEHSALPFYVRSCLCVDRMPLRVDEAMREIEDGKSKLEVSELLPYVERFVAGDERVLLLVGETGAGKSMLTVWLAEELFDRSQLLPVRVELRHVSHADLALGLTHVLRKTSGLKEAEIEELYRGRCVFILDGYDELRGGGKGENVIDALGRDADESARFIVTFRVRTLPQPAERVRLFGVAHAEQFLLPFTERQRDEYIARRVAADREERELAPAEAYTRALAGSSSMRELVQNPLALRLFVEALPRLGDAARKVSLYQLYEAFVAQRFDGKEAAARASIGFFCTELARQMFDHGVLTAAPPSEGAGGPSHEVWRRVFQQLEGELGAELGEGEARRRVMEMAPVRLGGGAYSFVHKSFWEYFLAVHLLDLAEYAGAVGSAAAVDAAVRAFGAREFHRAEPNVRDFLRDALVAETTLNEQRREGLMRVVRRSAADDGEAAAIAAANAVTVLHAADHRLAGADLRGVRIRGANLATAVLDGVNLRGADMRGVSLAKASLRGAQLQETRWSGIPFAGLLEGHTEFVRTAIFSSNGRHVVSASDDNTVRVWDAESGEEVRRLEGHTDQVQCASFSLDGRHVVSASFDKTVRVWDWESGEEVRRLEGHTHMIWSADFSRDGRHVVSASADRTVRVWDWKSGEEVRRLEGHTDEVFSARYSSDGRHVVSASSDKTVRVWDAESGEEVRRLEGHRSWVLVASFSADGQRVVTFSTDKTVRVWDVHSGEEITGRCSVAEKHTVLAFASGAFAPDGRSRLECVENTVQLLTSDNACPLAVLLPSSAPAVSGHVPARPDLVSPAATSRAFGCEGAVLTGAAGLPGPCLRMLLSAGATV